MQLKTALILLLLVCLVTRSKCQSVFSNDLELFNVNTGRNITIEEFKHDTALVLIFTNEKCPYSRLYSERITSLSDKYSSQNIQFAIVNTNTSPSNSQESEESMKQAANALEKGIMYLLDQNWKVKSALNIEKSPEVIILKPLGSGFEKIYQGAIDDSPHSAAMAQQNYIQLALDLMLDNSTVQIADTKVIGCKIK